MALFQLDPTSLAARAEGQEVPGLGASLLRGVLGFTVVSVAGFLPWALAGRWFYPYVGEAGLYAFCALVFIALSGPCLHRLIMGRGSLARFYKVFGLAFGAYAVTWIVCWLQLHGSRGEMAGMFIGIVIMGLIIAVAFDAWRVAFPIVLALLVLNAAGYYLGAAFYKNFYGLPGKLLWGLSYGVGFGAALGLAFYLAQERARALRA